MFGPRNGAWLTSREVGPRRFNEVGHGYVSDRTQFPFLYRAGAYEMTFDGTEAAKAVKRADEIQDTMIIVGVGHLAGDDSVLDMLKKKGHKVDRFSVKK